MEGEKPQDMEEIAEEAAADEPKKDEPEVFSENDTQDDSLDPDEERDLREHVAGLLKSDEDPVLAQLETINAIAQNVEEGMYSEEVARRLLEEAGVPTSDIDDRFNRDKPEGADGEDEEFHDLGEDEMLDLADLQSLVVDPDKREAFLRGETVEEVLGEIYDGLIEVADATAEADESYALDAGEELSAVAHVYVQAIVDQEITLEEARAALTSKGHDEELVNEALSLACFGVTVKDNQVDDEWSSVPTRAEEVNE